jgi:hypothetical protein
MFKWMSPEPRRPVLDAAYLDRLAGHLGKPVLKELMADGLIELDDRMRRLDELAEAGDLIGLVRMGHDLVGMAGHLGLSHLSAAAAGLARCGSAGPRAQDETIRLARQIRQWGDEAGDALRSHLGM